MLTAMLMGRGGVTVGDGLGDNDGSDGGGMCQCDDIKLNVSEPPRSYA